MSKQDNKDNKDKLRVYEYAKSLNMSSKEIITILKRTGIEVNNHMSVMENSAVESVEKFFRDVKANAAAKRAANDRTGAPSGQSAPAQAKPQQQTQSQERPQAQSQRPAGNSGGGQDRPQGGQQEQRQPQQTAQVHAAGQSQQPQPQSEQAQQQTQQTQSQSAQPQGQRPQGGGYDRQQGNRGQGGQGQRREYSGGQGQGQRYGGGQGGQGGQGQGQRYGGSQGGQGGQGQRYGGGQGGQGQGQRYSGGQGGQGQGQRYGGGQGGQGGQGQGQRYGGGQGGQGGQGQGQRYGVGQGGQGQGQRYGGGQGGQGGQGQRFSGGQGGQGGGQGGFQRRPDQNRPSGGPGGARPAAGGAPAQSSQPQRQRFDNNRPENRGPNRSTRPTFVPSAQVGDHDDVTIGKTQRKTKPTQTRFDDNKSKGGQGKGGRYGAKGRQQQQQVWKEKVDNTPKKVIVREKTLTVGEVAKLLHKDVSEVIKKLLLMGVMATINQEVDIDTIQLIATEFGVEEVEVKIPVDEENFELFEEKDDETDLQERPPVVTIMGHVDHGKTTLLDAIRSTNVSEGEAGGITQHIGAYQVEINGKKITFLDTPGHEAFTSMRARGAQVTDITIIVVAADDGVMPQTVEAINHAKAANVPIIIAVNKIDKPDANPDRIKQELTEYELVPEEWGGDTIFVNLSAKQRTNLEQLLEMILLVSEVQELKANPDKRARGTVIEAELDKGKGPVARVLIQHGTLRVGDSFVAGVNFGRVRAMVNDRGKRLKEAPPSTPVEITGLTEVPQAGDPFMVYEDERKAREVAQMRSTTLRQSEMGANSRVTLEDLYKNIKEGEIKDLNVIIKADVQGSVEALKGSLAKIEVEGARVKVIHMGAGAITESDIILASASNAIIIGFNVRPEPRVTELAEQEKVDIRLHRVIYSVIEEIEAAMKGMLDPVYKENVIGHAEIRNTFKVTKVGVIAGCMVIDGKMQRNAEARLIRGGIVVYEGKLDSLKRFKDDAKEVAQGYECGITLERFNDLKEGDIIEAFVMETVER